MFVTKSHARAKDALSTRALRCMLTLGAACVSLAGCAEPHYGADDGGALKCEDDRCIADASSQDAASRDARTGDARQPPATPDASEPVSIPDAASPDDAAMPAPTDDGISGKYALRMRFYGIDTSTGLIKYAQEIVTIGEIAKADSGYTLQLVDWCLDHATNSSPAGFSNAQLWKPRAYPGRTYNLAIDGDAFNTSGPPALAGWTAETPSNCSAGAQVAKRESQLWLTGATCTCPSNDSTPTSADDCRITDSDGDGKAGFTVTYDGLLSGDNGFARRDLSQLKFGHFDRKTRKHVAQYANNHEHNQLTCNGSCQTSPLFRSCRDANANAVLFEPLTEADYSCEAIIARVNAGSIFTPDALTVLEGC